MHDTVNKNVIEIVCSQVLNRPVTIVEMTRIGGGSINLAQRITTSESQFFLKSNASPVADLMFKAEAEGLTQLRESSKFQIPEVYGQVRIEGASYFLMEYIDSGIRKTNYWEELGYNLAMLHRVTFNKFGYNADNFIGSLPQSNKYHHNWVDFFASERILPMLKMAKDHDLIDQGLIKQIDKLLVKIDVLMPQESPVLLHGDLWSGNLMTDKEGKPTIIDPAVYYGHREMDLAFTHLFGGFNNEFYTSYNETYPLVPGFKERIDLCNLYPLLVHLNLFGRSYLGQIKETVERFI